MGIGLPSHHLPGDRIIGQDRSNVTHLCPECGGSSTVDLGASLLVALCPACHGIGTLTDAQLGAYVSRLNAEPQGVR